MTSRNASRSQNNAMTQSYEDLENRRPMTSRSASRNAMTQVDDDLRSRYVVGLLLNRSRVPDIRVTKVVTVHDDLLTQ